MCGVGITLYLQLHGNLYSDLCFNAESIAYLCGHSRVLIALAIIFPEF